MKRFFGFSSTSWLGRMIKPPISYHDYAMRFLIEAIERESIIMTADFRERRVRICYYTKKRKSFLIIVEQGLPSRVCECLRKKYRELSLIDNLPERARGHFRFHANKVWYLVRLTFNEDSKSFFLEMEPSTDSTDYTCKD